MNLKKGDKAPTFTLRNTEKKEISLTDYSGQPVVIFFFPLAFAGVCTDELCTIRDEKSEYDALHATVLGISVDSFLTLNQFKKAQKYNFELLSDFNKDVSRSYGVLYEEFVLGMKGVSKRSAFVIDGAGVIQYAEVLESAGELPKFLTIKESLNSLN